MKISRKSFIILLPLFTSCITIKALPNKGYSSETEIPKKTQNQGIRAALFKITAIGSTMLFLYKTVQNRKEYNASLKGSALELIQKKEIPSPPEVKNNSEKKVQSLYKLGDKLQYKIASTPYKYTCEVSDLKGGNPIFTCDFDIELQYKASLARLKYQFLEENISNQAKKQIMENSTSLFLSEMRYCCVDKVILDGHYKEIKNLVPCCKEKRWDDKYLYIARGDWIKKYQYKNNIIKKNMGFKKIDGKDYNYDSGNHQVHATYALNIEGKMRIDVTTKIGNREEKHTFYLRKTQNRDRKEIARRVRKLKRENKDYFQYDEVMYKIYSDEKNIAKSVSHSDEIGADGDYRVIIWKDKIVGFIGIDAAVMSYALNIHYANIVTEDLKKSIKGVMGPAAFGYIHMIFNFLYYPYFENVKEVFPDLCAKWPQYFRSEEDLKRLCQITAAKGNEKSKKIAQKLNFKNINDFSEKNIGVTCYLGRSRNYKDYVRSHYKDDYVGVLKKKDYLKHYKSHSH